MTGSMDHPKHVTYRQAALVLVAAWAVALAACSACYFGFRALVGLWK